MRDIGREERGRSERWGHWEEEGSVGDSTKRVYGFGQRRILHYIKIKTLKLFF